MVDYSDFLKKEMIPALGCTEPTAIAYAAALARKYLAGVPQVIAVGASGNLIKNAKSVVVPNSGGLKGIEVASILGAIAGNPDRKLEVLTDVTLQDVAKSKILASEGMCTVTLAAGIPGLYIDMKLKDAQGNSSRVVVQNSHTNVVIIEQNGKTVFEKEIKEDVAKSMEFSFAAIYDFAKNAEFDDELKEILELEIKANMAVAQEGLQHAWGAQIGRRLYKNGSQEEKEIAHAAAASDARMSGCELPVVINSGSGNQGLTISLPLITRAENMKADREELYRALVFANLLAEYQKANIGRLSAYCGAVSAAAAAAAGLAFLEGEDKKIIAATFTNALVTSSGLLCDGAKPSCAAKIATSLWAAYGAYQQAKEGASFRPGDGLVGENVDATVESIGRVASQGMQVTDVVILDEMIKS